MGKKVRGTCPHCGWFEAERIEVYYRGKLLKVMFLCTNKSCGLYW